MDIKVKCWNAPVWQLIGTVRDKIEAYSWVGDRPADVCIDSIKRYAKSASIPSN